MKSICQAILSFAVAVALSGCAGLQVPEYFTKPQSASVFAQAGVNCFMLAPETYGVGLLYQRSMTPEGIYTDATNPNALVVVLSCGDNLYTVTCDVTKQPSQSPCGSPVPWSKKPAPSALKAPDTYQGPGNPDGDAGSAGVVNQQVQPTGE